MADLKAGTTIGGTLVWTQGNFPLYPAGNSVLYKGAKIYTELDKPQASDNDFVSKASGGKYLGTVSFPGIGIDNPDGTGIGVSLYNGAASSGEPNYGIHFSKQATFGTHGVANGGNSHATYFRHSVSYPWVFRTGTTNVASINGVGFLSVSGAQSTSAPTSAAHLTRKDYVDGQINTVTNNANTRVLRSGDTMTGTLTAPNLISSNAATAANHVPRLDQVIVKQTIIDFGEY